jgi:hypothetical protein
LAVGNAFDVIATRIPDPRYASLAWISVNSRRESGAVEPNACKIATNARSRMRVGVHDGPLHGSGCDEPSFWRFFARPHHSTRVAINARMTGRKLIGPGSLRKQGTRELSRIVTFYNTPTES